MKKTNEELPPVSPRLQEAFKQVQDTINAIFGMTRDPRNKRKFIPKVSVVLVHEDGCDDCIMIDGWLYISETEMEEERDTIKGKVTQKFDGWYLGYMSYDPGVRYYPDGSGQPPSTDLNDCDPAKVRNIFTAVEVLIGMLVKNHIRNLAENAAYEKMAADESKLEQMPDRPEDK